MATPETWACRFCGRTNFLSKQALNSHLRTSLCANARENAYRSQNPSHSTLFGDATGVDNASLTVGDDEQFPVQPPPDTPAKENETQAILETVAAHDVQQMTLQMEGIWAEETEEGAEYESDSPDDDPTERVLMPPDSSESELDPTPNSDDSVSDQENVGPNTWIRDQFRAYCKQAKKKNSPFSKAEEATVRLMHLLKEKNAPMNAFEATMLWHLHMSGQLHPQQGLGDYKDYKGRQTMIKALAKRYNYEGKMPRQKTVKLPVSGTIVKLTIHSATETIQRLLTDPRVVAEDYLFFDGDPLAPPPERDDFVQDLNTGLAYLETHAKLIDPNGREQLMPVIIYFDGTVVSHFHDMEIIQVNIALGTMTRLARTKAHCWAPLGYIEKIHEHGGRGRQILAEANHMESQDMPDSSGEDTDSDASSTERVRKTDAVGDKGDQDFHAMMSVILEDFVALQETGFLWDHYDPITGVVTSDIHYKIFVPFLKVDGKEADLACAKYAQRSSTQQICRKCHVPLAEADDHLAKYRLKTVQEIKALIDEADLAGLQGLSQTYLRNAFYDIRFSMGNDYGVHGSCPSELLHAFLLGTFKYVRDIFFEMAGKTTERAKLLNALSKVYGQMFTRQSDRSMPGTAFSKGIQAGKLMAKDYRGVLLIMLAMLRSTKGREILKTRKRFNDGEDTTLDDWILLVELMLEWEAYLNEPFMYRKHVKRLEKKHRFIMYIMRKVAQRTQGMGLKLLKFHTILHIWEDILQFGVPLEYDTSANESMHKPSKKASKMTQKAADTFNQQTATRLVEFQLIDLAMEEIESGRVMWEYFDRREKETGEEKAEDQPISTGETRIEVFWDDDSQAPGFSLASKSKFADKATWDLQVILFLWQLQEKMHGLTGAESIPIYTRHTRGGNVFRGHPNFRGKGPWKDWVYVCWSGGWGRRPAHIWCFVVLEGLSNTRERVQHGGIVLKDGVYAVVESASVEGDPTELGRSDLFTPIAKECELDESGRVKKRTFYLADTDAFEKPCCVVPDIGGPPNRYFVVKPRYNWSAEFIAWIQDEHHMDKMDPLDLKEDDTTDSNEELEEQEEKAVAKNRRKSGKGRGNRRKK